MDKKKKILIIDDEQNLLDLLKQRLEHHGYEVMYLNYGMDAVDIAITAKPDLIMLDISIPDKDGYDICYELKHSPDTVKIPVIIFTAKDEWKKHLDEMSEYVKADDFVAKPFDAKVLLAKIQQLLKE
ncbi:MAG: response regulator transcription factor [Candidatus Omnitrophota bacterium]